MADNERGRDFSRADESDSDPEEKKAAHRRNMQKFEDDETDPGMEFDDDGIEER